ncbi:MAG: major capsid protein V20 domain-containing protein, partial [Candidatus Fonsibacter sp.]
MCARVEQVVIVFSQTDNYAHIKKMTVNFNNQAGLLSSMSPDQLWKNSVQSGLSNMSWHEFC